MSSHTDSTTPLETPMEGITQQGAQDKELGTDFEYMIATDYVHPHSKNASMPLETIEPPKEREAFELDSAIKAEILKLDEGYSISISKSYGASLWGVTAKVVVELPDKSQKRFFVKTVPNENPGRYMCEGQYESLKAMYEIVPSFIPKPYGWGKLKDSIGFYLITEFREIGQQPPDPPELTMRLAELHIKSKSPNGKFGFHVTTCHGNVPQYVKWESSWTVMYSKLLEKAMDYDEKKHGIWEEYNAYRKLLFEHVIPALLLPLETNDREIKPCLIHGDLWDENCADDMETGEPFAFDPGCLYAHNEYEIGYWRPLRHRLSAISYIRAYKRHFPVSEPEKDWDDRQLLYSLRWNTGCSVIVPASGQRKVVFEDMKILCEKYCPTEYLKVFNRFNEISQQKSI